MDIRKYMRLVPGIGTQGPDGDLTRLVATNPFNSQGGQGQKRLALDVDLELELEHHPKRWKGGSSSTKDHNAKAAGKRERREEREGRGKEKIRRVEKEEKKKGKGKSEIKQRTKAPGSTMNRAANAVGAGVAGRYVGKGGEAEKGEVMAECALRWDEYLQGREDKHRKKHIQMAITTALNYLAWNRVEVKKGKGKEKEEGKKGVEWGKDKRKRDEKRVVLVWAELIIPVQKWREELGKIINMEGVVRVGRVGGDHPRVEIELQSQAQRDQMVTKLREVWGEGANAIKAGREYEVRVCQRVIREMGREGKQKKGEWIIPKRVAKHTEQGKAEQIPISNPFAALTNVDTEAIEHKGRVRGGERRVCVATINLAGGKARVAELRRVIETGVLRAEVIAVQETWLRGSEIITMPGYTFFGSNRAKQSQRGDGGVGIFVANHLMATRVKEYIEEEWIWVRVEVKNGQPVYFCSVYGPQESESRERVREVYGKIGAQADNLRQKGHILILGDLNAKLGKGGERVGGRGGGEWSPNGIVVRELIETQRLWSLLDRGGASCGPTFYSQAGNSTVDHILVGEGLWGESVRARVRREAEIGSDHVIVEADIKLSVSRKSKKQQKYKRWRVERLGEKEVNEAMRVELDTSELTGGVGERWKEWKRRIRATAGKVLGEKKCGGRGRVGWWDQEVGEAVCRRREAFQKVAQEGNKVWEEYVECRREVKKIVKKKKKGLAAKVGLEVVASQAVGGKRMWSLLKQIGWKTKNAAAGLNIKTKEGTLARFPEEGLEAWACYFEDLGKGVQGEEFNEEHYNKVRREVQEGLREEGRGEEEEDDITNEEVEKAVKLSMNGRAPGSAGIPNEVVKATGEGGVGLLRQVMSACWREEKTPRQFKKGMICPVHKEGDNTDPNNFRGITVTSGVGKLYGRVLLGRVQKWCEEWLEEEQAGFRAKRGCEEQRVILQEAVSKAERRKEPLFMAFIDFRKAYDTVWREGVWWKMLRRGVNKKLLRAIMELYAECPTKVGVDGQITREFNIGTGLKQGCVLSPTLFIIFIDDIIKEIKKVCPGFRVAGGLRVAVLLFADDMVILAPNQRELQAALEVLSVFCTTWRLQVNLKKCKAVLAGSAKLNGPITYRGEAMEVVREFVYLGVPIHYKGLWSGAIERAIGKAKGKMTKLGGILGDKRLPIAMRAELARMAVRTTLEFGLEGVETKERKEMESVMHQVGALVLGCNRAAPRIAVRGELGWMSVKNSLARGKIQLARRAEERVREKPDSLYAKIWVAMWNNRSSTGTIAQARRLKEEVVGGEEEEWTCEGEKRVEERDVREWREEGGKLRSMEKYMKEKQVPKMEPYMYFLPAKLAGFRFKVKSRTLPVASFLAKLGKGNGECRMCGQTEDIPHFLDECRGLDEERRRCRNKAGVPPGQSLLDRLMQSGTEVDCSTPKVEWTLMEEVYKLWKIRTQSFYRGQTGLKISSGTTPTISRGKTPTPNFFTTTHTPSHTQTQPTGATGNAMSQAENQALVVPRVNGPFRSKISS